jgi:hypothetical protein
MMVVDIVQRNNPDPAFDGQAARRTTIAMTAVIITSTKRVQPLQIAPSMAAG